MAYCIAELLMHACHDKFRLDDVAKWNIQKSLECRIIPRNTEGIDTNRVYLTVCTVGTH